MHIHIYAVISVLVWVMVLNKYCLNRLQSAAVHVNVTFCEKLYYSYIVFVFGLSKSGMLKLDLSVRMY